MTPSFMQALYDPIEGPLLRPLFVQPNDAAARAAYLQWLSAQGDLRAELLSLVDALDAATQPANASELRLRFAALREQIDPMWLGILRRHTWVLHCGAAKHEAPSVRFAYECPMTWEELAPTTKSNVRSCQQCNELVYECASANEAATHARAGHCISVPSALAASQQNKLAVNITGRPHVPSLWARQIFDK